MKQWMTQAEAAKRAGVSRQLVGMWITRGKLPTAVKYGIRLVALEDVMSLVKGVDTINK